MSKVFVVMLVNYGCRNVDGTDCGCDIQLRQVFRSIEKARLYCEDRNHYLDDIADWHANTFDPVWNDSGTIYTLKESEDSDIYFSIQTRELL